MLKKVVARPEWLRCDRVEDIGSVSACITGSLAHDLPQWELNDFGWANSPSHLAGLAEGAGASTEGMTLFYYELFEHAYDEERRIWAGVEGRATAEAPARAELRGYDVVCFSTGWSAECSPLSCNGLAEELPVNRHCLFDTLDQARQALDDRRFDLSEPGPFRIVAVHIVDGHAAGSEHRDGRP